MGGWPGEALEESGLGTAALGSQGCWSPSLLASGAPLGRGTRRYVCLGTERTSQCGNPFRKEQSLREVLWMREFK